MKILEITYSLSSGGAERFVVDLCNELSKDNSNQVTLIAIVDDTIAQNKHYLPELSRKVEYICLGATSGFNISSFIRVFKMIRTLKPDIVHAHCNLLLLYLPALFLGNIKYIHTLHNIAEACLRFNFLKPINKLIYKRYVQPITISSICQLSYENLYKSQNAECIPNGRSPIGTTTELVNTRREIDCLKNTPNDKIFLHIARFDRQKNQGLLIKTFKRLYDENEQVQLLIIGAGHQNNDSVSSIECPRIHIFGEKKNIGDYLACADFFILSSLWEGLPISLLEAMSMGVIPVCTPAGGIPDVIEDGITGYLSESFSDDDFYSTIKRALADCEKIDKTNIIRDYNNKYSMVRCAKNYMTIYQTKDR